MALSSPLLDQYNRDGQLTPAIQQALDAARQNLGAATLTGPQIGAPRPMASALSGASAAPAGPTPSLAPPPPETPNLLPRPAASASPTLAPPTPSAHQQELTRLTTGASGRSGISKIHSPAARVPLQILDALGSAFLPALTMNLPGTQLHHQMLVSQAERNVGQDDSQANDAAKRRLEGSQAAEMDSRPELNATKAELAVTKETNRQTSESAKLAEATAHHKDQTASQLHQHGYKQDEKGNIVPLPYEEMSEDQQAVHDLRASQEELADARAALSKAQKDNIPKAQQLAEKRIQSAMEAHGIASRRLGLSEQQFEMRAHGTQGGDALPGAMQTDEGTPVGTAFQQNVRPTGTERNKGDMAKSAHEQIGTLKDIVSKRADIFGPANGRVTDFNVWLGSQDPDAQRFRAARTIAGDHLAGTFGGRSETALKALDDAIGQFKDNPQAVAAGLDQLEKGNRVFQKAGTVHTVGGKNELPRGGAAAPGVTVKMQAPDGSVREVPADQAAHYRQMGAKEVK